MAQEAKDYLYSKNIPTLLEVTTAFIHIIITARPNLWPFRIIVGAGQQFIMFSVAIYSEHQMKLIFDYKIVHGVTLFLLLFNKELAYGSDVPQTI